VLELTTIIETPSSQPSSLSVVPASTGQGTPSSADPSAYSPPPGSKVSPDGTCGQEKGYTCFGSQAGPCCSSSGYCGSTDDYCGKMDCQPLWGYCDPTTSRVKVLRHRHQHMKRDDWARGA
jgi:hypothetical protein